jgi:hypothetical protein
VIPHQNANTLSLLPAHELRFPGAFDASSWEGTMMTRERKTVVDVSRLAPPSVEAFADNAGAPRQEIELRAYYRYCERGCAPGGELEDWLAAEQEVLAAAAAPASSPVESSADDRQGRTRSRDRAGR